MNENGSSNNRNKITALLREYGEQRTEIRLFEVLGIICIVLSALTSSAMLVAGVISKAYILLLISPTLSLFFIVLAMALGSYIITLLLRLNDIEEKVNKLMGESVLDFSLSLRQDILEKGIGKYWFRIVWLGIAVGVVPFIISLWRGINLFSIEVGAIAWLVAAAYSAIALIILYLGYGFFIKSNWQNVKLI
jgi:hypothetical protein